MLSYHPHSEGQLAGRHVRDPPDSEIFLHSFGYLCFIYFLCFLLVNFHLSYFRDLAELEQGEEGWAEQGFSRVLSFQHVLGYVVRWGDMSEASTVYLGQLPVKLAV